jgi:type VI secretion system protein ImpI/type VI secretion system protein
MALTLTVLRCPPNVAPEVRNVTGGEFSIGRGAENDWVLPDPARHLSKRHCVIAYRQGTWQIAGTSTNGTFINGDTSPLESRPPQVLQDGDRIVLGVYEIEVGLAAASDRPWGQSPTPSAAGAGPFGNPFDDDIFAPVPPPPPAPGASGLEQDRGPFSPRLPDYFDPLQPEEEVYPVTQEDHSPAVSDAISLPHARSVLPADWDLDEPAAQPARQTQEYPAAPPARQTRESPAAQPARPTPESITPPSVTAPPPPAPKTGAALRPITPSGDLFAAFLRGAGMQALEVADPARTMEQLGAAFRAIVAGIRQALIARSEVKRAFRIEETVIRRRGNNLLKFSANDDDALTGLLGAGRHSDMGAAEAIADALTNIRLHELATATAMQSAVRALVVRLGPAQIIDTKEQAAGMAFLSNRKARAWDAYEALHAEILRDLSDDFDSVFGKRFALAYEQAMEELVARQKNRRDDG